MGFGNLQTHAASASGSGKILIPSRIQGIPCKINFSLILVNNNQLLDIMHYNHILDHVRCCLLRNIPAEKDLKKNK